MKRTPAWLACAAALTAWAACGGTLKYIDIPGADRVTVEKGTVVEAVLGDFGFGDFTKMDLTDSQQLQNQGVEPGDITTARLMEFSLEAVSPSGSDLSFIEKMSVYVEGPDLPRQLLASASDFPAGESLVQFELEDVELRDYVVSESLTLDTEVSGSRPDQDTTVEAAYLIEVGATLQAAKKAACAGQE